MTDTLHATIKSVGDSGAGSWTAVASAPVIDRDGEVIAGRALSWQGARVPVHAEHFGELVGSGRPYYEGDVLYIDGQFASTPKAQQIRTLVTEGHLAHMSVVFMAAKRDTSGKVPTITQGELLAVDFAPIPSNRDARVLAARSFDRHQTSLSLRARKVAHDAQMALVQIDLEAGRRALALHRPGRPNPKTVLTEAEQLLKELNRRI
jgi:HK97 family phage prohead protease